MNNYYAIWTGYFDYEIRLWNCVNMHCDLVLKVNSLENRKELRSLTVEIPYLNKEGNNSIIKFTHRYDNNFTKNIILSNLGNKLTENTFDIFSNMTNL